MSEYQLEIKQIVDYPRCRIYRQFIQTLLSDRSIRLGGGSGLFYYTVLCSYANFRTSYKRIDGISYTICISLSKRLTGMTTGGVILSCTQSITSHFATFHLAPPHSIN